MDFNDDYPTCLATYATFRALGETLVPAELTRRLRRQPSQAWRRGDVCPGRATARTGGWLLSSEDHLQSRDVRRHLWWLRDRLESRHDEIRQLRSEGVSLDVFCYWVSASGHGGPIVDATTMAWLSNLGIPLSFDIYFS